MKLLASFHRSAARRLVGFAVTCALLSTRALGFSYQGHNIIEAQAYLRILSDRSPYLARFPDVTGKHVLDTLISIGVLTAPDCWVRNNDCLLNENDPLRWLPVIRSGEQDFMLAQQFSSKSQAFHFMARSHDVYRSDSIDPMTGVPTDLLDSAYPRCLRYLRVIFDHTIEKPRVCCVEEHDIYVLMHSIADSYSAGHVERDSVTNRIVYLKPWQARAWLPYLIFWSGWKYYFTNTHHSFGTELRDEAYAECSDASSVAPYTVSWDCISERGRAATDAIEDLIVTVYAIARGAGCSDGEWNSYVRRHLEPIKPALADGDVALPRREDREFESRSTLGVQYRQRFDGRTRDILAGGSMASTQIGAVLLGFGGSVGLRRADGVTALLGVADVANWTMPLTDEVAIGFSPLMVSIGGGGGIRDLHASFIRLDLYPWQGYWLRLEGPRYSYFENEFLADASITVGRAFELTSTELFGSMLRSAALRDGRRPPRGEQWRIPDSIPGAAIGPLFTGLISPVGVGFHRAGSSLYAMVEMIFDRNSTGIRTGAGVGAYVRGGVTRMREAGDGVRLNGIAAIGPELRFKLPLAPIPISLTPLDAAYVFGPASERGFELTSMVSLPIDLGSVEVALDLVRFSWKERRIDHPLFPAGVHVALSYHESHVLRLAGY